MSNQLIKETALGREQVFPKNYILNLKDKDSGANLEDILKSFNMLFLPYLGNKVDTRKQVPMSLRHGGLWITYIVNGTVVTEWYDSTAVDDYTWGSDAYWREGSNMLVGDISISKQGTWVINGEDTGISPKGDKGDSPVIRIYDNKILVSYDKGVTYEDLNNTPIYTKFRFNSLTNTYLVSYDLGANWLDISNEKVYHKFRYNNITNTYLESTDFGKTWSNISAEKVYYQFRYNEETNTHLVSTDLGQNWTDVSSNKVYYQFRTGDNRLLVSTDLGTTWENCSEPIAAWFRWADTSGTGNIGKVQISRDNSTWTDLSPTITNNLYIKGYVAAVGNLPSNAAIGDIYMVGPTYDESDTTHDYPHYRMWVKQSSGWVDNGEYLSNVLMSLTTGLETGITMSLKAITNGLAAERSASIAGDNAEAEARQAAINALDEDLEDFKEIVRTQFDEYQPIQIEGDVMNAPDEEDITSVSQNGTDVLKFKNRNNLYGMGMIILRRDKTFAEQLTQTNTIYIIQYDFNLSGERVIIPENCVLDFNGGSLNNGTISNSGKVRIWGYGNKCLLENANNFLFMNPYCVSTNGNDNTADGSPEKPFQRLYLACSYSNNVVIDGSVIYPTFPFREDDLYLVKLKHNTHIGSYNGKALITGLVKFYGTSSSENNITVVRDISIKPYDKEKNYELNREEHFSEEHSKVFNFGFISDGAFVKFRTKAANTSLVTGGSGLWSNRSADGQESYNKIVIGTSSKYDIIASVVCRGIQNDETSLIIENVDFRYIGSHAIAGSGSIEAINCDFAYIGGSWLNILTGIAYGNALLSTPSNRNAIVSARNCSFVDIFDAGVTIQGNITGAVKIIVKGCTFKQVCYGIEYFNSNPKDNNNPRNNHLNAIIENNIFVECYPNNLPWYPYNSNLVNDSPREHGGAITFWKNGNERLIFSNNILINTPCLDGDRNKGCTFKIIGNTLFLSDRNQFCLTNPYDTPHNSKVQYDYSDAVNSYLNSLGSGNVVFLCYKTPFTSATFQRTVQSANKGFMYFHTDKKIPVFWDGSANVSANGFSAVARIKGTTAQRPTVANVSATRDIGFQYFDTDLGKPIFIKAIGSESITWVDAVGATV